MTHSELNNSSDKVEAQAAAVRFAQSPSQLSDANANNSIVMLVGGRRIDRRVLDEARSLIQAGWEVTVIAGRLPSENDRLDEEVYSDVNIIRINKKRTNLLQAQINKDKLHQIISQFPKWNWSELFRNHDHFLMEALMRPARIYVAHDLPQLPAAAMAAAYFQSFLVYDAHELYPEQDFGSQALAKQYSQIDAWLSPFADKVITVNKSIAAEMAKRYEIALPEIILNCPAMDAKFLPLSKTNLLRGALGIPDNLSILLYQGNLGKRKRNLENLVSAMAMIKRQDVALVLMGADHGVKDDLSRMAQERNLLYKVFFHNPVPPTVLLQYTASAEAGIVPYPDLDLNTHYCTPNKLFEFIVAGLPILANDLPELNRFVSQQQIGLNMPMTGPEDIAQAIDLFFSSDLIAFRTNAQRISPQYIWQTQGQKIVDVYQSLVNDDHKPGAIQLRLQTAGIDIKQGKYDSARKKLLSIMAHNPGNVSALNDLGVLEYMDGKTADALKFLNLAIQKDHANPRASHNLKAITLLRTHKAQADKTATRNILVVLHYPTRTSMRATIRDHIYAFEKYSNHRVHYLNFFYDEDLCDFQDTHFDLIIFHTVFLSKRWGLKGFKKRISSEKVRALNQFNALKIALPQDEFLHTDVLCDFINEFGITHVFSVAPESEWPKIYHKVDFQKVKFSRVLTGYLDDDTVAKINTLSNSTKERMIDIGYRAWRGAMWLGRHGFLKGQIADLFQKEAPQNGLLIDISTRDEDTFVDDEWYRFLQRCKYFIGVEGGASILDYDGSIKKKTEDYLAVHPGASFEEVEAACFPNVDGNFKLFAISPRHLEACATRTCQVLVEGEYNGILEAGKHYIELKRDFSNIDEVLEVIKQDKLREAIVERAYQDIVESGKYTYKSFVENILRVVYDENRLNHSVAAGHVTLTTPSASDYGQQMAISKGDENVYVKEPLKSIAKIPVFSATSHYTENYELISQDHLAAMRRGISNPFMSEARWIQSEQSTIEIIRKYSNDGDMILDVGVGLGRLLSHFPNLRRYGMDISIGYLQVAASKNINVCYALVEDMPYKLGLFDMVVCTDVFEHVIDLNLCCAKILSVLKEDGMLLVRVPYREDLSQYAAADAPYKYVHFRNFDENSLILLFQKVFNCEVIEWSTVGRPGREINMAIRKTKYWRNSPLAPILI